MFMSAADINRRFDDMALDFRLTAGPGGHWVLYHAGMVAMFLGTDEEAAAHDCRMFLAGLTHAARKGAVYPDVVHAMLSRLEELAAMPAERAVELPGWILR